MCKHNLTRTHIYTCKYAYTYISIVIILIRDVVHVLETQCNMKFIQIETYDYMNAHRLLLLRLMM